MKHLFGIFIPLCICSFIAFGISTAILGVPEETVSTEVADNIYTEADGDGWTRVIEGNYTNIDIKTGTVDVKITPADAENTTVKFTSKDYKGNVITEINGGRLVISAYEQFSFHGFSELIKNITNGIKNGFVFDFSSAKLEVTVPQKIYDRLDVDMGSGSVTVDGVRALSDEISIGSGGFYLIGADGFTVDKLSVELGSGYFSVKNTAAEKYDISVGSGSFNVEGLSGSGNVDMGSGSGAIGYGEINGNSVIDVSSGSLNVIIPSDASAVIKADIGSGSVRVNACGVSAALYDGQKATLNGGKYEIKAELGSGSIKFTDGGVSSSSQEYEEVTANVAAAVEVGDEEYEGVTSAFTAADVGITAEEA